MKKAVMIIVLVGLVGWVVFDFVQSSDPATVPSGIDQGTSEEQVESVVRQPATGLRVGDLAPDFTLTTLAGETVALSDYRGERVMLNFWATWCPPCRAEMPDMQQFHEDTDIVILAVNLTASRSDERGNIPRFVDKFGITFDILLDEETAVAHLYEIKPIPTNYLINSDGTIHNVAFGALNYDLMVQEFARMK